MAINSVNLGTDSIIGVAAAGTTVAGSFTTIGGVFSGSMSIEHNEVDTTNNDDVGFTSFKPGNTTITVSVECRYDPVTDSGGQGLIESLAGDLDDGGSAFKTLRAFSVKPNGAVSTEAEFTFDGYVSSFELNPGANDEPVNLSFEFKSVGASLATAAPAYAAIA